MKETPVDPREVLGLEPEQLPRHIAIIMDGNGRWARQRGLPRIRGHEAGTEAVREIVTECARLGIGYLTLYSFSTENWRRPKAEIDFLMDLYARYLVKERPTMMDNDVRFLQIGRREPLPEGVLRELDETVEMTRHNRGLTLLLALNYGSRQEIVDAARAIAADVAAGRLAAEQIDEHVFARALYTAGVPDPDLLIRTAGERRVSNYLLWQISYAEIYVEPASWPEYRKGHLHAAIRDFAARQRRFGDIARAGG